LPALEPDPTAPVEVDETRESFAEALSSWGLTPAQVTETLEGTDFGLGLVELRGADGQPTPGVAIVVDDRRDRELRELFDWREQTTDESYAATWEMAEAPLVRVILGPDEQALVRFAITIRAPAEVERRFLFAVATEAAALKKMQVAGTGIWLVPSTAVQREMAREGPADTYDVLAHCLRAGTVERAVPSIDEALAHVGSPRMTVRPANRAERRAAARKKKPRR
jgi:uncharacterized protein with GYD domain